MKVTSSPDLKIREFVRTNKGFKNPQIINEVDIGSINIVLISHESGS